MKTKFIAFAFLILIFSLFPAKIGADEKSAISSANFDQILKRQKPDSRALALKKYLNQFNSPLAPYAKLMVNQADANAIPWDLVPAIAGTEGTFGEFQPKPHCNNTWGWGVYADQTLCFPSYDIAIRTISRALRTQYIDKYGCRYVEDIGRFYASSPTWSAHTIWFMKQIEQYKENFDSINSANTLPISL